MIKLIIAELLNKKTLLVYIAWIVVSIIIFKTLIPTDCLVKLNFEEGDLVINVMELFYQIFSLLFMILTTYLMLNHDQEYINNLTTYVKRSTITSTKMLIYLILITCNFLIFSIIFVMYIRVFDVYFLFDILIVKVIFSLYFDNCLAFSCFLLLSRIKNKQYIVIIITFYMLNKMFNIFSNNIVLFYILPFYNFKFNKYKLTYIYQFLYFALVILLNYYRYKNEEFA